MGIQYIKQLMESIGMFINGPVFYIISTDENETPREALWSDNYCVKLRDFRGRDIAWRIDSPNATDQMYGREMVIGFDPAEQLQDVLDKHRTPEQSIEDVYLECFKLIRFIKSGGDIVRPLEPELDDDGHALFFGSILDINKVPIIFQSKDMLSFWLDTRGVKVPDTLENIRRLVTIIYDKLGNTLKPMPVAQMRGSSGWVTPEVLVHKDDVDALVWKIKDDLMEILNGRAFPDITDVLFTALFGKRNGVRERVLRHIHGGSFNLSTIKATLGMKTKIALENEHEVVVIEGLCAPSQKLKEDGREAFHPVRLCLEVDNEMNFVRVLEHPYTTCGCPVGWIWCAHKGALVLNIHSMIKFMDLYDETIDFDIIEKKFPQPVHELMKSSIPPKYFRTFIRTIVYCRTSCPLTVQTTKLFDIFQWKGLRNVKQFSEFLQYSSRLSKCQSAM